MPVLGLELGTRHRLEGETVPNGDEAEHNQIIAQPQMQSHLWIFALQLASQIATGTGFWLHSVIADSMHLVVMAL